MSSLIEAFRHLPFPSEPSVQHLLSLQWWLEYLLKAYEEDPGHVLIEVTCFIIIIWLLFRKSYDPSREEKLSRQEEDQLIAEWRPDPLTPQMPEKQRDRLMVVESATDAIVRVDGRDCLNFASTNFLGISKSEEVKAQCAKTIDKYGVGSCGPRGFYGTIDVHLNLEEALAKFYGVKEAILYSDGIACVASVIPAFCKKGDLVICDEAANWGIQQGIRLSRSNVLYFKHNDMEDLERVLQDVREKDALRSNKKLNRRFIIVEGIYQNHGDVCPLNRVMQLKQEYKYRIMIDDSLAVGVLGANGKGSPEHWGVPIADVEVLVATMDNAMATVGGFCVGLPEVVDHQRLSGLGYCFSASSPPYVATAGLVALSGMDGKNSETLRQRSAFMRKQLKSIDGVVVHGDDLSPVAHLRLQHSFGSRRADEIFWKAVEEKMYADYDTIMTSPRYVPAERSPPEPSLKICVTVAHTEKQIQQAIASLKEAFEWVHTH